MSKEVAYQQAQKDGLIDKSIKIGKTATKITLPISIGVTLLGVVTANPVLIYGGATGIGADLGPMAVTSSVERARKRAKRERYMREHNKRIQNTTMKNNAEYHIAKK